MIYFITGNKNKFGEAKAILPEIKQLEIDLPEIQDIDPRRIIETWRFGDAPQMKLNLR